MKKKILHPRSQHRRLFYMRPAALLIVLPFLVIMTIPLLINTYVYTVQAALVEEGYIEPNPSPYWQESRDAILASAGIPNRSFGYYKVRNWETLETISTRFGISATKLKELNPAEILPGTTIKVPPIESALQPKQVSNLGPNDLEIIQEENGITIQTPLKSWVVIDLPQLNALINNKDILEQVLPRQWRIKQSIFIDNNIRLQIISDQAQIVELESSSQKITCLCSDNGQLYFQGVSVRSWDPSTNGVDQKSEDGRAFVRARRNSRMDIISSDFSYLGYGSDPTLTGGGNFGVSWRIPNNSYGSELVTGWVENSQFHHNYFGNYTFGAFGMTYRGNVYFENEVYGLDPHDDSNGALIENNIFHHNQKHGFIASKRCNNNIIRGNLSYSNGGHGFMLHQDSNNNILENNQAYDNVDNIALYSAHYTIIRGNKLQNPRRSNIRLNEGSLYNVIQNNRINGGKGIKIYEGSNTNAMIENDITTKDPAIDIDQSSYNNVVADNTLKGRGRFRFDELKKVIVGKNSIPH